MSLAGVDRETWRLGLPIRVVLAVPGERMKPMDASDLLAIETLLFTNRIREAQEDNPRAHRELINWGAASRHVTGLKPALARPGWCQEYDTADWNDVALVLDDEVKQRRAAAPEVKAEPRERHFYRDLAADNLCVFLHATFKWRQRRCLSVAYYHVYPEHQYADRASRYKDRIDNAEFLALFGEALKVIERDFP